ncbi:MAG: hypothetical protein NW206_11360 [Hyphomonadaceae bacterium]|nr:hypothetical protein [Hyphomonadaceae bacterium]
MSSIRPTISAKLSTETITLAAVALLALAAGVLSVRDARAAYLRMMGVDTVVSAEAMDRGAARDRLLDQAQVRLHDALEVYPRDASLWRAMARTRYLQATGAEVTEVSPPLLQASAEAARRAEQLDPASFDAPAQLAQALALLPPNNAREAAEALGRSYLNRGPDPLVGVERIETAARLWPALPAETQEAALAEACLLSRQDVSSEARVRSALATSAIFSSRLAEISQRAGCAPGSSIQSPDN